MDVNIFCFCFFFLESFFPQVRGTRKDVKHGSKVKGKIQRRTNSTDDGCGRERPQSTPPHTLYQSKYHCYIATLRSLALVSGNARCVHVLPGPAGRITISSVLFPFLSIGGPANLCDSVATECLPAAECSAAAALTPPSLFLARCLPADHYRLASLLFLLLLPPLGLQAKSSSFRTGPSVLNLLLLLRQSLSSATSTSTLSVSLLQGSL